MVGLSPGKPVHLAGPLLASSVDDRLVTFFFIAAVFVLLGVDLFAAAPKRGKLAWTRALALQGLWMALALGFLLWLWSSRGVTKALEFVTGYAIEYALSLDNLAVFVLVFRITRVPETHRRSVLFWGILGALLMRGVAIVVGSELLRRLEVFTYVLALLLVVGGLSFLRRASTHHTGPAQPKLWSYLWRILPVTRQLHGSRFYIYQAGQLRLTPLGIALLLIESADLVFALDSIPAIFAVTTDPLILFTSNACAILGLRSLYFLVASGLQHLRYLDEGLGILLVILGIEMALKPWWELPPSYSLGIVIGVLGGTTLASLCPSKGEHKRSKAS
ncbi:TerC/Alx family metal homeostasis membrane protein [Candidatus Methylacidithermus pantelleriae]|uniref:Tellurium resistance protein TerC n=1 Tax=Candidatus Methylacidithermus pantelleriae TaxID=2744239 RepID=A0A8J2FT53_9BACT|nr:TerC/Alx family metal homeostasis membrane protein [Candidatus Methylacidithermus pantelleriae]CAF0701979.1 Tellurium resistance protein TerC [Candidatus Methylacidithermus pantelleriae]